MNEFSIGIDNSRWHKRQLANDGCCFLRGTLVSEALDIDPFEEIAEVSKKLDAANGFYAAIFEFPSKLVAAVDHVRSIPLFYASDENHFIISDDAEWVRVKIGDIFMDEMAKKEFLMTGYVTGSETLYPRVKQLQAGEMIIVESIGSNVDIKLHRYYRFSHEEPFEFNEAEQLTQLHTVTTSVIERLIDYAGGRQIVLPLSGGFDSRLIAVLLKKLNYQNVLCFTYGVPGNRESKYSKYIANTLGYAWKFVEYSNDKWREAWSSPEAERYRERASNHCSLPHVQDWLAIKELVSEGLIDHDAVIVPGHSGDFVAGSHIPDEVFKRNEHRFDNVVEAVITAHYSNVPTRMRKAEVEEFRENRIGTILLMPFDGSPEQFADFFETWDWQERQAKYIVNSVRVYEDFELDWWLPLWDKKFIEFWEAVPLKFRKHRIWFKDWIVSLAKEELNFSSSDVFNKNAVDESLLKKNLRYMYHKLPTELQSFIMKKQKKKTYESHFLGFWGLVPKGMALTYIDKGYNLMGAYSDLYINKNWGDLK